MAAADTETATFAFNLAGNAGTEALKQADALSELKSQISGGLDELREMQKALRNLKGAANVSTDSLSGLKAQIAAQRASIGTAQESYLKLGGGFKAIKRESIDASGGLAGLGKAFASISKAREASVAGKSISLLREHIKSSLGPLGQFASEMTGLSTGELLAAAAGIATAGAMVAVTAAVLSATTALLRYGLAQADARRSELLRLEGLTKIRFWWAGFDGVARRSADSASFLQQQIDSVSASVALGRDKITDYASQLYKMGLRGGNLQAALKGVATTAAVQGDAQAQVFASWAAGTAAVGGNVKRLADDVEARLGGIAKAQLLSLDAQTEKLHESFSMLFSGLKLDLFLGALQKVTSLFSQSTVSGRALRNVISKLMQPLLDSMSAAGPYAKRFFQGLVIGALGFTIALLTARKWWRQLFGDHRSLDLTNAALYAGVGVAALFAATIGIAALALWTLAAPVLIVVGLLAALGYGVYKLFNAWNAVDWVGMGLNVAKGIANGITGGAAWVWNSIKNLASGAVKAFTDKLEIHSPSALFMRKARAVPQAVTRSIDDGRAPVRRSVSRLVDPADLATGSPAAAPGGSAGSGGAPAERSITVTIQQLIVQGGETARDQALAVRRELEDILEGLAIGLGARKVGA